MTVGVGLSGGVDSAVTASLLQEAGYEVRGYMMTLGREDEVLSVVAAQKIAAQLNISLEVFDFAESWHSQVLDYVGDTYRMGLTPNPCVRCNEKVKFNLLPMAVFKAGCDFFATGHYAVLRDGQLFRATDRTKDQSYFLYRVRREVLLRTLFPLGEMTKAEVRAKANEVGFEIAEKADSQDFCGGDPVALAAMEERPGVIVDSGGKRLGEHNGFWHFTIGQRKGIGIGGAGEPYYVTRLEAMENRVIVGRRTEVMRTSFMVTDTCWISMEPKIGSSVSCRVKVRSSGEPKGPVVVTVMEKGAAEVSAPAGIFGVAPGQSAVFYADDSEAVLGGGVIV